MDEIEFLSSEIAAALELRAEINKQAYEVSHKLNETLYQNRGYLDGVIHRLIERLNWAKFLYYCQTGRYPYAAE